MSENVAGGMTKLSQDQVDHQELRSPRRGHDLLRAWNINHSQTFVPPIARIKGSRSEQKSFRFDMLPDADPGLNLDSTRHLYDQPSISNVTHHIVSNNFSLVLSLHNLSSSVIVLMLSYNSCYRNITFSCIIVGLLHSFVVCSYVRVINVCLMLINGLITQVWGISDIRVVI